MANPSSESQEVKKPDREREKYHTLEGLHDNARIIQRDIVCLEYVHLWKRETEEHRETIHNKAKYLVDVSLTTDEELMTRFCCGLFANPSVWLGICQQWEAVGSHLLYSGGLVGNGKIWTLLLHTLVCPPNLQLGIVPIFQQYQTMIYPYGMDSCTIVELLLSNPSLKGLFKDTPLDIPQRDLVTSPGFLRFDVAFLPVLAGRLCLCCLRTRKCFTDTSFQYDSDTCYRMSNLTGPTHFIYNTLFEHFRPCIVACMMVALCWSAHKRGPTFVTLLSETIDHFLHTIEHARSVIMGVCAQYKNEKCTERGLFRKSLLLRIAERMGMLKMLLYRYFHNQHGEGDYSLQTLHVLYESMWDKLRGCV